MKPVYKKIIPIFLSLCLFLFPAEVLRAEELFQEPQKMALAEAPAAETLHAHSAVLMDGTSGRILYEKNGQEFLANASTTKILTCILALEKGNQEDLVTVSSYAASMPAVKLGMREGEQYYLRDLLYSLMLESHNDTAVAIAEHISGSVEAFAMEMNRKAREIGCTRSFFVTPNGLDGTAVTEKPGGERQERAHGTTAEDLAKIMRYCVRISSKRADFLEITGKMSYGFNNQNVTEYNNVICGNRSFLCNNHNNFLNMMEGALSGKTGFTGKAGYCYVGALKRENREYIVALLACGWPGHKTYKWQDTRRLMEYGLEQYQYCSLEELPTGFTDGQQLPVEQGQTKELGETAFVSLVRMQEQKLSGKELLEGMLLAPGEEITVRVELEPAVAPIVKEQTLGKIEYWLNNQVIREDNIAAAETVERLDMKWCLRKVIQKVLFTKKCLK